MRDRTLIILALIFLVLTISTGVKRSLAACSRIAGQPLAPEITQIYREKSQDVMLLYNKAAETAGVLLEMAERKKNEFVR